MKDTGTGKTVQSGRRYFRQPDGWHSLDIPGGAAVWNWKCIRGT